MVTMNKASDQSMLWGNSLEFWDGLGRLTMFVGAGLGILALIASLVSAYVLYRVADIAQKDLESAGRISAERIAALNNDTERLKSDNLALQTVLLPRHVGLIGFNQEPPAKKWFAGFEKWAGTKILIQVIPGDPEAQNLANEIAIVLSKFGWRPEMIDKQRSGIDLTLHEGVDVLSPSSYKAWDPNDAKQQNFARLAQAARALAWALTKAGLGVGGYPVHGVHGLGIVVDFPPESPAAQTQIKFPTLDGVYLQVGSRPVSQTVQWIANGRPNELANPEAWPPDVRP